MLTERETRDSSMLTERETRDSSSETLDGRQRSLDKVLRDGAPVRRTLYRAPRRGANGRRRRSRAPRPGKEAVAVTFPALRRQWPYTFAEWN